MKMTRKQVVMHHFSPWQVQEPRLTLRHTPAKRRKINRLRPSALDVEPWYRL